MDALLFGEIEGQPGLGQLALIVEGDVRESSHYAGGRYVLLEQDDALATFEIADSTTLVRGDAESLQYLQQLAAFISLRLTKKGLRHRLELYLGEPLVDYYHHAWPSQ